MQTRHLSASARTLVPALLAALLLGCESLGTMLDGLQGSSQPEARVTGASLDDLSLDTATLTFDVEVSNPYTVPLPLMALDYGLVSSGTSILTGQLDVDGQIEAGQSRTLSVPAQVRFVDLFSALKGVRPGNVVPYQIDLAVKVDAPVVGALSLPVSHEGELPVPTVPDITLDSVEWGALSLSEASAKLMLRVENLNDFPFDLEHLDYALSLGGSRIVETGLASSASFAEGSEQVVEIPLAFAPMDLGFAVFNMLTGEGSDYELTGSMNATTPFGPLDMPFQSRGETTFLR